MFCYHVCVANSGEIVMMWKYWAEFRLMVMMMTKWNAMSHPLFVRMCARGLDEPTVLFICSYAISQSCIFNCLITKNLFFYQRHWPIYTVNNFALHWEFRIITYKYTYLDSVETNRRKIRKMNSKWFQLISGMQRFEHNFNFHESSRSSFIIEFLEINKYFHSLLWVPLWRSALWVDIKHTNILYGLLRRMPLWVRVINLFISQMHCSLVLTVRLPKVPARELGRNIHII